MFEAPLVAIYGTLNAGIWHLLGTGRDCGSVSAKSNIMLKVIIRDGQLSASDTVYICYWLWLLDYSEMGSREWEFVSL